MPRALKLGFRLYVLAMVLTLIAGAFDPSPPGTTTAGTGGPSVWMLLAAIIPLLVVKALLIAGAYGRRNWARIALLILTGLGLGAYAPQLVHVIAEHPLYGILNLLLVIGEGVAIVLLFTPAANRWYKPAKPPAPPAPPAAPAAPAAGDAAGS